MLELKVSYQKGRNMTVLYKTCSMCKNEFPLTVQYFTRRKDNVSGWTSACKECRRKWYHVKRGKIPPDKKYEPKKANDGYKFCVKCDKEFPATSEFFSSDRTMHSGLHSYCKKCLVIYGRKKKHDNLEKGGCYACGKDKLEHSAHLCFKCWVKATSLRRLKKTYTKDLIDIIEKQKYICPYTGDVLVPGHNMSLEHIEAASVNSDRKRDINNVTWVSFWANAARGNLSHKDFYEHCKKVVDTYEKNRGFVVCTTTGEKLIS